MSDLQSQFNALVTDYNEEIMDVVKATMLEVSKDEVKQLKAVPIKRTGEFARGWSSKIEDEGLQFQTLVYNKKKPGLTHLLEHGHAKRNGGRVEGREFISPIEQAGNEEVIKKLKERIPKI